MARRILILALLIAGAIALAQVARDAVGTRPSADSVESWVSQLGWKAPAAYLGLVTFRHLLLLPSTLILTVGGVCFGALVGGALGAAGVILAGIAEFVLLRTISPQWLARRAKRKARAVSRAVERGAPMVIALSTAIPPMPMSTLHCAAAFTSISLSTFILALCMGAAVRSYALALLGSGLLAEDSSRVVIAVVVLAGLIALSLLYRPFRRRLFPSAGDQEPD